MVRSWFFVLKNDMFLKLGATASMFFFFFLTPKDQIGRSFIFMLMVLVTLYVFFQLFVQVFFIQNVG